jgi:hypothetical protein
VSATAALRLASTADTIDRLYAAEMPKAGADRGKASSAARLR